MDEKKREKAVNSQNVNSFIFRRIIERFCEKDNLRFTEENFFSFVEDYGFSFMPKAWKRPMSILSTGIGTFFPQRFFFVFQKERRKLLLFLCSFL